MKVLLFVILFFPLIAVSGQQYNTHTGELITVPDRTYDGSEADKQNERVQTYNPHDGNWSLEKPDAQPEYNPHTGEWEYPR